MSRPKKIALIVGGSILGLIVVVFIAGIIIVQTQWFRDTVRNKIVTATEDATGGKVDVGSFSFDWTHLRAVVRNFVIHGLEPPGAAPLFRANLLQVDLKLTSPFHGGVDIAYLLVDTPQADVIVYPDGHTNVPSPKTKSTSNKNGLQTVVDLAIGRFDLRHGSFTFAERKSALDASGENLRAQLGYNALAPQYTGEIDISPLYVKSGANQPANVNVKLPITLEKDRIALANAQLTTPESEVTVTGSMDHLANPREQAHINARIALDEAKRVAGLNMPLDTARGPRILNADVTASMADNRIQVQSGRVSLGHSAIEAHGTLETQNNRSQNANFGGTMQFNASLALGEIGRLMRLAAQPEGTVRIGGNAALTANNAYAVTANIDGRNMAFRENGTRIAGVDLATSVSADPHRIEVAGLRLSALGGSVTGSGAVENMAQFHFAGDLHHFDIDQVMRAFTPNRLGYDGIVSGPVQVAGNLKNTHDLVARANLAVGPGPRGVPVAGRLNADYDARGDTVTLGRSYLQMPHTRIDLSGSLGSQIQVRLVTRDFSDFKPVAAIPAALNGGAATVDATVSGSLSAPHISGRIAMNNFSVEGRPFTQLAATVDATKSGASITNASLTHGALQAQFSASVGLRDWKPESYEPLRVDATVRNADLRDVLALAGQSSQPATGELNADAHMAGTIGSPQGNADLSVVKGTIEGEPFDSLTARVAMTQQAIELSSFNLTAGKARLDANATYQHAPNDLKRGSLRAHVASNQVQLAQFQSLVKDRPGLGGALNLNADVAANLYPGPSGEQYQLLNLNANASARGLTMEGKPLGDFTATAQSAGQVLRYNVNSDFAGSTIRGNGQSENAGNHRTSANLQIANLPIQRVLAVAGRRDIAVTGELGATAALSGTLDDPHVTANLTVGNGLAYQQKFSQLRASINYSNQLVDIPSLHFASGPNTIDASASLAHPAGDYEDGQVHFNVRSNRLQLAGFPAVVQLKPGLAGTLQVSAEGAATLRRNAVPLFANLNADIAAQGLTVAGKPVGDLTATAETRGRELDFHLASDFARADIRGGGRMQLAGDYPLNAQLTFSNVTWSGLGNWLGETAAGPGYFDASAAGQVNVSGPATRMQDLRGEIRLATLEAHSVKQATGAQPRVNLQLRNQGDVLVSLDRSVVTIRNFRIAGPDTTLAVTGSAPLTGGQPVNLRANGNIQLDILEALSPDIFSAGKVVLNAAVTGTAASPAVNGRLELQNASFNILSAPNGLSNANGSIVFTGSQAVIQNITGESGGGKITLAGFVAYGGPEMQVRVQATADKVRIDYPETVSTEVTAKLTLAGTTARSLLSGNVSILDVALHSHSRRATRGVRKLAGGKRHAEALWRSHDHRGRLPPRRRAVRDAQDLQRIPGPGL
ncbi:MAG: translocation/assembly module TamB domain-containing protein [Acidobacteriia bacterium]|nr:translocation/assembly module TamB domain-containing protein [Terriglobia bacterium]